jgi:hypothetical protein
MMNVALTQAQCQQARKLVAIQSHWLRRKGLLTGEAPPPAQCQQVAGGHPVPQAQEKGVDDERCSNPGPVSTSQVAGGHPVPLAQDKGVVDVGEAQNRPRGVNNPGSWRPSSLTGSEAPPR